MKTFDELYSELLRKTSHEDPDSGTVKLLAQGVHAVGKKVVEEAAESWMAAEFDRPASVQHPGTHARLFGEP